MSRAIGIAGLTVLGVVALWVGILVDSVRDEYAFGVALLMFVLAVFFTRTGAPRK